MHEEHRRMVAGAAAAEVGHLEGDLIIGAANRSAIVTVVDRASRPRFASDLTT